jgi:homocysteine S-methyltransferase
MTTTTPRRPFPTDTTVITDAGLETWLVFDRGIDLPAFAAYPLVATAEGRSLLVEYFDHYARIAEGCDAAVLLEAPTWRANPDWAATLGHDRPALARHIAASVDVVESVRQRWTSPRPFLIGGAIGPRGDGYVIDATMSADEAADYHAFQIECLAGTPVDVVTGMTLGYVDEAVGIAVAARRFGLPVVISFTVETDGRLPSGIDLGEAIRATDDATAGYVTHFMINCAHPTHFDAVLDSKVEWVARIGGLRANASALSHAELDAMTELDAGDPDDLAKRYVALRDVLPSLRVVGGCCGTDHNHVERIAAAWTA